MRPLSPRRRAGRPRHRAALLAVPVAVAVALSVVAGCSSGDDDSAGDPDLFCDSAREAFTGDTEFDFGDPAQRQQVLDVLDRMVEYAPGEIKGEAEATRDAVQEYAEQVAELAERQAEIDSTDSETISPEAIEQIQDLVTEIEQSEDLQQAQAAIEPYLRDTCGIDLTGASTTTVVDAAGSTTTTATP